MKPYEKYIVSGVEWIGDIPDGWEIKKIKYVAQKPLMYGANESPDEFDETQPRYIRITDIDENGNLRDDIAVSLEMEKARPYLLKKNDILFARSGATVGKSYIFDKDIIACFAGYMIKFEPKLTKVMPKFAYYVTFSKMYLNWIESNTIQATIQNVSAEKYNNFYLPLPCIDEQNAIITYLDIETASIDNIIKAKETLIERLKEKRIALITHAVTKGLDTNAKMKPSGVDWIGDIPQGWDVKKLKYLSNKIIDGTHATPEYISDGIPFLRVTDISLLNAANSKINWDTVNYISKEEHAELSKRCNPQKGDLLVSKNGTIGIPKVVDWEKPFSIFVSLCLIKIKPKLNVDFLYYYFLSALVWTEIAFGGKTGTITNLHLEKIKDFRIPFPTKSEQIDIVNYLNAETLSIDTAISKTLLSIEKLKEYRTALISACVTGRLDVRSV